MENLAQLFREFSFAFGKRNAFKYTDRQKNKSFNNSKSGFKSFEQVIPFSVSKPFEVGDELTNLLKMKRSLIADKYMNLIEELYREKETNRV